MLIFGGVLIRIFCHIPRIWEVMKPWFWFQDFLFLKKHLLSVTLPEGPCFLGSFFVPANSPPTVMSYWNPVCFTKDSCIHVSLGSGLGDFLGANGIKPCWIFHQTKWNLRNKLYEWCLRHTWAKKYAPSQVGSFPQRIGVKVKSRWGHHLVLGWLKNASNKNTQPTKTTKKAYASPSVDSTTATIFVSRTSILERHPTTAYLL